MSVGATHFQIFQLAALSNGEAVYITPSKDSLVSWGSLVALNASKMAVMASVPCWKGLSDGKVISQTILLTSSVYLARELKKFQTFLYDFSC